MLRRVIARHTFGARAYCTSMHRAYLVRAHGPPSSHAVESIPTPVPEGNEVLVSVKAAGVNFPDSLIIRGKYQFQPQFPYSPGGEFSGVVDAVGPDVTSFSSGDRVVGMSIHGSYSEKLITDESKLAPMPQSMDFATGAVVQLAHGTMLYALKDVAKLERGETLLVLGAGGGVGLASVELGKLMGARVVAVASSSEKLAAAKALGADVCLDYSKCSDGKALKALLKEAAGSGFDVAVDPVGDFYSEPAIRSMGWGGRYLVIGFAAGSIPKVPLNLPLLKNCSLSKPRHSPATSRRPARPRLSACNWRGQWVYSGEPGRPRSPRPTSPTLSSSHSGTTRASCARSSQSAFRWTTPPKPSRRWIAGAPRAS